MMIKSLKPIVGVLMFYGHLTLFCGIADAHTAKQGLSSVLFNARSGNIEVAHRYNLHDLDHAWRLLFKESKSSPGDDEAELKRFSELVQASFFLQYGKHTLPLQLLGFELESKYLWVYQEAPQPAKHSVWRVKHNALKGVWPNYPLLINFEWNKRVRSISITPNGEWQTLELTQP